MRRTQIYLTDEERQALKVLAEKQGRSQSAIIREAVDRYLQGASVQTWQNVIDRTAGLWKDREDIPDRTSMKDEWVRRSPGGDGR